MEKKANCPTFSGELHTCFVEELENGIKSYLCFDCGYTSNSALKIGTEQCKIETQNYTKLVKDLKIEDEETGLEWYPSVINMGTMGMIYPEGTADLWNYKVAKVKAIPEADRKNYPKEDGTGYYETFLDIDGSTSYRPNQFLEACKELGITQHVEKNND